MQTARQLERVFNPKSVAVVGDKKAHDYMWLRCLSNYEGRVYSVQVDPEELVGIEKLGIKNYFSVLELPEPVDYAIVAVPRTVAPRIVADCIKRGVGGATLFTSGFAESNTDEGISLQQDITRMAREADFNLIGPNCMGIFNPRIGLRHDIKQYYGRQGPVGFISQSGTHAIFFSLVGERNGLMISKAVSYGNGAVLDSTDYLEYLAEDEETRVIGLYIEGVRDGRRLFKCLRETSRRKPVVVWKGGRTEAGTRATASHTGSLSSSPAIWEAAIRQCGAISVGNLEEMVDTVKALLYLHPPLGKRVGLVAHSGGQSVVITDAFTREGLAVPMLTDRSYEQFASFFNIIGGSYLNPLDIAWNVLSVDYLSQILTIVGSDDNIDSLVLELCIPFLSQTWDYYPSYLDSLLDALRDFKNAHGRCFSIALIAGQLEAETSEIEQKLTQAGLPTFPTFERTARALRNVTEYYRFHREHSQ